MVCHILILFLSLSSASGVWARIMLEEHGNNLLHNGELEPQLDFADCIKVDSISCLQNSVQQYAEYGLDSMLESVVEKYPGVVNVIARSLRDYVPENMKRSITEISTEGRGRARRILRILIPIILAIKVKLAIVLGLIWLGVIILAKKAFFFSMMSVFFSGFMMLKRMMMGDMRDNEMGQTPTMIPQLPPFSQLPTQMPTQMQPMQQAWAKSDVGNHMAYVNSVKSSKSRKSSKASDR